MTLKRFSHLLLVLTLIAATTLSTVQRVALAQSATLAATQSPTPDLQSRLAAIEKAIEAKRQEYHIPGASLVIVKDDKVIYMKGLGLKDVEHKLPVTPDTLFAIGSSTKAFTAMAAAMSADDGKLSLNDSPKKFLPYFKMRDAETDAKITLRDLLSHRSGIDRTDLSMVSGKLSREELIRVAGMAKPTAKLGEKFLYQNVMFAAAGEIVARSQNTTWDDFIKQRIFNPLGMKASNTTVAETLKSSDYALGYIYNPDTKETRHLPMREIIPAAPAGAISSTARDMAEWLRLMLGEGVFEGRRLVSEKDFKELVSVQNKVVGDVSYGLGWFLRNWNVHKVVEHGGNIDGFNAEVAFMPDQKLGFVLLTNISASPLGSDAMEIIWSNLVGRPEKGVASKTPASDMQREVGRYLLAEASMTVAVVMKDGKLLLMVPGQPQYELQNVGGRRYKLIGAPEGFSVTFRPVKNSDAETEMYLEQPQGNFVLARVKEDDPNWVSGPVVATNYDGPLKDLLGSYEMKGGPIVEIKLSSGKVSLVVEGQPAYPLVEKEKDKLSSTSLPDYYGITVKRDSAGKVSGIVIHQPEGDFEFTRLAETGASISISVDDLAQKVIAALGGEENLRKHRSRVMTADMVFEHQGLTGTIIASAKAPNSIATHSKLFALGKEIETADQYFDGKQGVELSSFLPPQVKTGKALEDERIQADFHEPLDWKKLYRSVLIKKIAKIGDEEVYVVVKTPEKGNKITDYISTKTFLILQRDTLDMNVENGVTLPVKEVYSDYRMIDGEMVPFKSITTIPSIGDIVTTIKDVKFNVDIADATFHAPE